METKKDTTRESAKIRVVGMHDSAKIKVVGRNHILLNPENNVEDLLGATSRANQVVHIFYTDVAAIQKFGTILEMLGGHTSMGDHDFYPPVAVFIHLPKSMEDFKTVMNMWFAERQFPYVHRVMCERHATIFKVSRHFQLRDRDHGTNWEAQVFYKVICTKNGIKVRTHIEAPIYDHDVEDKIPFVYTLSGAVKNSAYRLYPEIFKQKIIDNFKALTPEGILKAFKTDDDIWAYITDNDEWFKAQNKGGCSDEPA